MDAQFIEEYNISAPPLFYLIKKMHELSFILCSSECRKQTNYPSISLMFQVGGNATYHIVCVVCEI
jgi:hypothetical protein